MDEQRALIEKLMGQNSNLGAGESNKRRLRFDDNEVDKNYLVLGFSPHDALQNTRSSLGVTHKTCDPDCKAQWDALPQEEKDGCARALHAPPRGERSPRPAPAAAIKDALRVCRSTAAAVPPAASAARIAFGGGPRHRCAVPARPRPVQVQH